MEKFANTEIYFLRQKLQPDYWWEVSRKQAASIHKYLRMNLDLDFNYGDDDGGDNFDQLSLHMAEDSLPCQTSRG